MGTFNVFLTLTNSTPLYNWLLNLRKFTKRNKEKDRDEFIFSIDFINQKFLARCTDKNATFLCFSDLSFQDALVEDFDSKGQPSVCVCIVNLGKFTVCLKNMSNTCLMNIECVSTSTHSVHLDKDILLNASTSVQLKDKSAKIELLSAEIKYMSYLPEEMISMFMNNSFGPNAIPSMACILSKDVISKIRSFGCIESERDDVITFKQLQNIVVVTSKQFEITLSEDAKPDYATFTTKRINITDLPNIDYNIRVVNCNLLLTNDINNDVIVIGQYLEP